LPLRLRLKEKRKEIIKLKREAGREGKTNNSTRGAVIKSMPSDAMNIKY